MYLRGGGQRLKVARTGAPGRVVIGMRACEAHFKAQSRLPDEPRSIVFLDPAGFLAGGGSSSTR